MAVPYIDTPRTDAGNATFMTNGGAHLDALSVEASFASPSKDHDLIKTIQNSRRGTSLKTPRVRAPFADRRNLPTAALPKGEFTPLMKSVTKNNFLRGPSGTVRGVPQTPAFIKDGYKSNGETPVLPRLDHSAIDGERTSSSVGGDDQGMPVPQIASSSAQSTPLAVLPRRDGEGALVQDGNVMTLREQENIIDKIEKENFGLKLKIHYLEEALRKSGPGFNQAALKENTELKVTKVTMQKDLHRYRKNLGQAERELEAYRLQLEEIREKAKKRHADEGMREELQRLRNEVDAKDSQIKDLQSKVDSVAEEDGQELGKLRDDIEDMQADLREKERIIDEKDDEIDGLRDNAGKESNAAAELEEELETARKQIEELYEDLERANAEAKDAMEEREEAVEEKKQAEDNLKELQEEMSNKSFSTKGLSRQLEERANKLEDELESLRREHAELKGDFEDKARQESRLSDKLQEAEQKLKAERQKGQEGQQSAQQERDTAKRDRDTMSNRLQPALEDIRIKTEEKDLLQSRHDALTNESGSLQRDLAKARSSMDEFEQALAEERQHALDNDRALLANHKDEIDRFTKDIDLLHREVEDKESQLAANQDQWESQRRSLESQRQKAEEQALGLRRTVEKLQETEGTLSGREMKLQEALESEKQRHHKEEEVLNGRIKELNGENAARRASLEENRNELTNLREELRTSKREEASLQEKIQSLEDEVEVLQANLEEEIEYAKEQLSKGVGDVETQLQKALIEKQSLRDQLANVNIELHGIRSSGAEAGAERDELRSQLQQAQNQMDSTLRLDQEKIELRKAKLRLETEVARLKEERKTLSEANTALEKDLDSEIERAAAEEARLGSEIDQLQTRLLAAGEGRDRELLSTRSKSQRLELRVKELEDLLQQQPDIPNSPAAADLSLLRHDLSEARKKEAASLQREANLKSTTRDLKSQISALERQVHELQITKLNSSPRHSPSTSQKTEGEIAALRTQLSDAHHALNDLRARNRDLERHAHGNEIAESERADLHALLKASTLEAEALALKISDRDAQLSDLKAQLSRLRSERNLASKRADAATRELEALQSRYEDVVERMDSMGLQRKGVHEKEIRGLSREIMWLRAKWKREEGFRKDLAWSKGFMGLGERVRVACNDADLKMIAEMGVRPPLNREKLPPRQKLRSVVYMVMASVRMQRLKWEWGQVRKVGDGLRKAKGDVLRKRAGVVEGKGKARVLEV